MAGARGGIEVKNHATGKNRKADLQGNAGNNHCSILGGGEEVMIEIGNAWYWGVEMNK